MPTPVLEQRLLTVDEYHAMAEAGILTEEDRVELIDGKIITMSPAGPGHVRCVIQLNYLLGRLLARHGDPALYISVQDPVQLDWHGEPEPDLALLRLPEGPYGIPLAKDVLLIVEVADTSLEKDRQVKTPRYAAAGIPEVWIVALQEERVEVYRRPTAEGYALCQHFGRGDVLEVEALPSLGRIPVEEVLGP